MRALYGGGSGAWGFVGRLLVCGIIRAAKRRGGVVCWRKWQQGRVATNRGVSVQGFPNRFDLTVTDLHLADPVTGFGWDAPFAQVFSMTWKPWHLIGALPNSQTVTLPDQVIELASTKLQGSLKLVPGAALALDGVVVDGADLVATSSLGWVLRGRAGRAGVAAGCISGAWA